MPVRVELFGIPRVRAGVAEVTVSGTQLGDVLSELAERFPALAECCINGRALRNGFTVNIGGERFVSAPDTPLHDGDCVLLMSHDAGG
jgi:molybdopterin converting factor small subunit